MNRKRKLIQERNESIFKDFKKLFFEDCIQIPVIYARLSKVYFLDEGTIGRIVSNKKKELRESSTKEVLQE